MAQSLREGRSKHLQLDRFVEALEDPTSGLTYPGELYVYIIKLIIIKS